MKNKKLLFLVIFYAGLLTSSQSISIPSLTSIALYNENFFINLNEILPKAYAQEPVMVERGRHYEKIINPLNSTELIYRTGGEVPLWALNPETGQYQPTYYKEHPDGTKEFRNGYITVKENNGAVSYYDAITGNEKKTDDEDWLLLKDGSVVSATLINTQIITNTPNKIVLRQSFTSPESDYDLDYIIEEDKYLDHEINWRLKQAGQYQWQQKWKGIDFDVANDKRVNALLRHDFTQNPEKLNQNIPQNVHERLELQKNGQPVIFEKTGKITGQQQNGDLIIESDLLNFELDPINKEAKFHWGSWNLNGGENIVFNHGDTFSSNNPTEDGYVQTNNASGSACPSGRNLFETDSVVRILEGDSDITAACAVGYSEWDITSIPSGSDVTNTVFKFDVVDTTGVTTCTFTELSTQPSTATGTTIWDDVVGGIEYVNEATTCDTAGDNKSVDLGSSADTKVENQLSADWFGIGGKNGSGTPSRTTTEARISINSEEGTTPTPAPTLEVTYTSTPTYVADSLSVYQSSSTTLGSGTAICTSVDLESASSCNGSLDGGTTYRYEVTIRNDGSTAGTPNQFDFQSAVGAGDVLGSIPVGNILNSGCSTNTNWTESIVTTTARASAGTTCSISASGGTAVYWMVITLDTDANSGTATFFITDGTTTDTSTTTTFTIAPEAPTGLGATTISTTRIDLSWTAPATGPTPDGYKIDRQTHTSGCAGGSFTTIVSDTGNTDTTYQNTGLTSNTCYSYRVWSLVGTTVSLSPSNTATNTTIASAPTGLGATGTNSTNISLSWTAPTGDGTITGYKIEIQSHTSGCTGGSFSVLVADTGSSATTYNDNGRTANTCHAYRVSAINQGGTSAASTSDNGATDFVDNPTLNTATAVNAQINLSWTAPATGTALDGYKIERRVCAGGWSVLVADTGTTATTYSDTTVAANTCYGYRITGLNIDNESGASNEVTETSNDVPSAPTALNATATLAQIDLEWNTPTSDGGDAIFGYKIERQQHTSGCTGGSFATLVANTGTTATTYSDLTVSGEVCYSYRVSALNDVGAGPVSNTATETANGTPDAPSLTASTQSTSSIEFTSTAGTSDGGSPVKDFSLQCEVNQAGSWSTVVSNSTLPIDRKYLYGGLNQGDDVTCQWRDGNVLGWSNWSNNATDIVWVVPEIVLENSYIVKGDVLNVTNTININNGIPSPTIDELKLYEDGNLVKTISINSPTPPSIQTKIFYYQFSDGSSHNYAVEARASNAASSTTDIGTNTTKSREFPPDYFESVEGDIDVNFTHSRLDSGTKIYLQIHRTDIEPLVNFECNYMDELFDDGDWVNLTSVGYFAKNKTTLANKDVVISCYNDELLFTTTSGSGFNQTLAVVDFTSEMGAFLGVPLPFIFIILITAIITGRTAPVGIVMLSATIGIMGALGYFPDINGNSLITTAFWTLIAFLTGIGLFLGKRYF